MKVGFVGDMGAGKTHMIYKLIGKTPHGYIPTKQVCEYPYGNLILVDIPGEEGIYAEWDDWFKGLDAAVIMNTLIDEFKQERQVNWVVQVKANSPNAILRKFTTFTELQDFLLQLSK